jgi:hypothetical protein
MLRSQAWVMSLADTKEAARTTADHFRLALKSGPARGTTANSLLCVNNGCERAQQSSYAEAPHSLDDLIGACEEGSWDAEPKNLGSLKVYDEVEFGRLSDWEVRRLAAFQNLMDIVGRLAPDFGRVWAILEETAKPRELNLAGDGRHAVFQPKFGDPLAKDKVLDSLERRDRLDALSHQPFKRILDVEWAQPQDVFGCMFYARRGQRRLIYVPRPSV